MSPDRLFGLAYVCERWHSGQWSRGYRLLGKLGVRWGSDQAWALRPKEEWAEARVWAAHYARLARRKPGML